jgi:dTDP-4-amino-4,6-dideoxygalactose transaminase
MKKKQWFYSVLDTNAYINGPQVQQFQKSLEEYLMKHVLRKRNRCFTNCDDGMDLKPGDEVMLILRLLRLWK